MLNLAYFGVEFAVALTIGSVALFADSIDFLEDASVNLLILAGLGWRATARARLSKVVAGVLLVPCVATALMAWHKIGSPAAPDGAALSVTALGALAINLVCALMPAKVRNQGGSLTKAAFLSSRNDVLANVGVIIAGILTAWSPSKWPGFVVGLVI